MATIGFQLAYGNPHIIHVPQHETSNSFQAGDLVCLEEGAVQLPTSGTTSARFFGVAQRAATATSGYSIPVHVISPEDIFIAQMALTSTTTQVGEDFAVDTTAGSMSVTTGGTGVVCVIDFFEPAGTATGKVLVKFVPTVLQGSIGTTT